MDLSESAREALRRGDETSISDAADEPFDPADDAYAQAELQRRVERMDKMIEKARQSD